jgi:predicted O-methyltransferase YrrM
MPLIAKYVRVVQRRRLECDASEGYIFPLLEDAFTIDTHMFFEERLRLFSLATSLPRDFVACEIGSYLGASTSFLAAAASLRQGHVHAVDTWQNDAMQGEPAEDTWERFLENVDRFRIWITVHRGQAREMKDRVPQIDLLFVDGDHGYEATLENLSDYVPKLKPGGILILHDFDLDSVKKATSEYFKDRPFEDLGLTRALKAIRVN